MSRWSPYLLSVLRIIAAFVYMAHGTQKLFGFPAPFPMPRLPPLFLAAGIIETFGGFLLLFGLFTRPVALILSGEMDVAYFKFHGTAGILAATERRGRRGSFLLHFSISREHGWRAVEL
jgi:putative oxidoreductase